MFTRDLANKAKKKKANDSKKKCNYMQINIFAAYEHQEDDCVVCLNLSLSNEDSHWREKNTNIIKRSGEYCS